MTTFGGAAMTSKVLRRHKPIRFPLSLYDMGRQKVWRSFGIGVVMTMAFSSVAQHIGQVSLFMQDKYGMNPAYGGMDRSLAMGLHFRAQWAGIAGNPEQRALTAHMPLYAAQGGVGLRLINEQAGAERQTGISLSYNYVIQTTQGVFSIGLRPGILQKRLDGTLLRAPEGIYEGGVLDHLDGQLPNGVVSGVAPMLDAGLFFSGSRIEAGLSMLGFFPGGISLGDGIRYRPRPGVFACIEYKTGLTETLTLYPGALVKADGVQLQAEAYLRAAWTDKVQALLGLRGFSARSVDALVLGAGIRLSSKFVLHYAYDITLSGLSAVQQGTHELLLRYNLGEIIGAGIPPRVIYNPRNL